MSTMPKADKHSTTIRRPEAPALVAVEPTRNLPPSGAAATVAYLAASMTIAVMMAQIDVNAAAARILEAV